MRFNGYSRKKGLFNEFRKPELAPAGMNSGRGEIVEIGLVGQPAFPCAGDAPRPVDQFMP